MEACTMEMFPSRFDSDGLLMLDQITAALVSAGFEDVAKNYKLFRLDGKLKGLPFVAAGPEERRAEFEEIVRSFDPDASPEPPAVTG
jgi:hypothetical protein